MGLGGNSTGLEDEGASPIPVTRRVVLYVHGFDPRGPGAYHRMFVEEAAKRIARGGAEIAVGPRRRLGQDGRWQVAATFTGEPETLTDWRFLRWDDAVRSLWTRGWRVYLDMWTSLVLYARAGYFRSHWRTAWPSCVALIAPPVMWLLFWVASLSVAIGPVWAARALAGPLGGSGVPALIAATAAAAGVLVGARKLWRMIDDALRLTWLSRSSVSILRAAQGRCAVINAAAGRLAEAIAAAAREPGVDELMVIAHSQGAGVAVMALARALANGGFDQKISFLTLGQTIGGWDQISGGTAFHHDLVTVLGDPRVFWLDVTSPSDGAATGRLDPGAAAPGARPGLVRRWPQFHLVLEPERFRRTRTRQFDYHFLYLSTMDRTGGYDVFRLTCGPDPLAGFERGWTSYRGEPS